MECLFCGVYRWCYYLIVFVVFCDYGSVYSCEVGVYVLFCNGIWVCNVCYVSNVICFLNL